MICLLHKHKRFLVPAVLAMLALGAVLLALGCGRLETRKMEITAYCGCRECCDWERGSWKYLKLNFWNRYVSDGGRKGARYYGQTASGKKPRQVQPGLFSLDSVGRPWMIPVRVLFFPWMLLPRAGTIAADTQYYPMGTKFYVPGYGWGVVQDRGGAIKGPDRLDLYYRWHSCARNWGRQRVEVKIKRP